MNPLEKTMRAIIKNIVVVIHTFIFGRPPGDVAISFLKNLGYVSIGFSMAKLIATLFQIYVGRILGPTEYGKFGLVITLSQFLVAFMGFVFTGMIKFSIESKSDQKARFFSAAVYLTVVAILLIAILSFLMKPFITSFFNMSDIYLIGAVLLAVSMTFSLGISSIFQSTENIKRVALLEVSRAVVLLAFFLFSTKNVAMAIFLLVFSYFLSSTFTVLISGTKIQLTVPDLKSINTLLKFGLMTLIVGGFSSILLSVPVFTLKKFGTLENIGYFQAYSFSTLSVAFFVVSFLNPVLFPATVRNDKSIVLTRINSLWKVFPVFVGVMLLLGTVFFFWYGTSFKIDYKTLAVFAVTASLLIYFSLYSNFFASLKDGINKLSVASFFSALFAVFIAVILKYNTPLEAALYTGLSSLIGITILILFSKSRYKLQQ